MRWWLLAGAAMLAIVAAVVLLRAPPGRQAPGPEPAPLRAAQPLAVDAGCPAVVVASRGPAPSTSLTLAADASVSLSVDGFPFSSGARVMPGTHVFEAHAASVDPLRLSLEVKAFTPVVLEIRAEGHRLVAVVAGANAPGCEGVAPTRGQATAEAPSVEDTAEALATGDCRAAFEQLRRWPEARRPARLAQAALGLTGQAPRSLERLSEAPRAAEASLERAWLVARWNAVTEQLSHATAQLAGRATGVVTAANERMASLSDAFGRATERDDLQTQRDLVEAAGRVLRGLAEGAVALHPHDCSWQAEVQAALK